VTQGEEMYEEDNVRLGEIDVKVPYNEKECEEIQVTFTYDINAILVVDVKVSSTREERRLVITGKGLSLSEEQIAKYIQNIQNMKLAHHERIDYLKEWAKRLYTEGNDGVKQNVKEIVMVLEKTGEGSKRKINETLDSIEEYLKDIEKCIGGKDIFNDASTFLRLIKGGLDE